MKSTLRFALLFLAGIASAGTALAQRGEAVLWEGPNFSGRHMVITDDVGDLALRRFNDVVRSIEVKRGAWEFCDESYYRGPCKVMQPGNYPKLGSLSGLITSARLVAGPPPPHPPSGGPPPPGSTDEVVLYDRRDFQGYLATLSVPTRNFDPLGFNDRVASIVVRRGSWEFCTDGEFRGTCRVYGPGQYPQLPGGQDDAYSSARPVHHGGGGGGHPGKARIVLFENPDFSGRSIALDSNVKSMDLVGFNDRTESLIVERGTWRLCTDANGGGTCRDVPPGRYPKLPGDMRNKLSSAYVR